MMEEELSVDTLTEEGAFDGAEDINHQFEKSTDCGFDSNLPPVSF